MATSLTQLTQRPDALAVAALPAKLDPVSGVTMADLAVSYPAPGQVLLVPTTDAYSRPGWPYYGHAVASYTRVDFADAFGDYELRLKVDGPTSHGAIAALMGQIFGVALVAEDVIAVDLLTITPGMTVVIQADPDSPQWTGQRAVKLYLTTIPYTEAT